MKPRVFLSHSKPDKIFIEKIANDLRSCGIDVWYDEWEIPPGESLRKKIFEEGITTCDVFFVYLTSSSLESVWVKRELDSAFIHETELKNSFILLYVDSPQTRNLLSIDLKALNIPEFNEANYLIPFGKMITKTWQIFNKGQLKNHQKDNEIRILELENKILQIRQNSVFDFNSIKEFLSNNKFEYVNHSFSLLDLLLSLRLKLANGCNEYTIRKTIEKQFKLEDETTDPWGFESSKMWEEFHTSDFTGELILKGIIELKTSVELDQYYYLTSDGIEFLRRI